MISINLSDEAEEGDIDEIVIMGIQDVHAFFRPFVPHRLEYRVVLDLIRQLGDHMSDDLHIYLGRLHSGPQLGEISRQSLGDVGYVELTRAFLEAAFVFHCLCRENGMFAPCARAPDFPFLVDYVDVNDVYFKRIPDPKMEVI